MMYKKGIVGRCLLDGKIHFGWQAYPLPMNRLDRLKFEAVKDVKKGESFYRFVFDIKDELCNTFLRTDAFKKGFALLNGFNLGRYWEIGPQKTLYVPSSLLLIVFESDGLSGEPVVEFTDRADLG